MLHQLIRFSRCFFAKITTYIFWTWSIMVHFGWTFYKNLNCIFKKKKLMKTFYKFFKNFYYILSKIIFFPWWINHLRFFFFFLPFFIYFFVCLLFGLISPIKTKYYLILFIATLKLLMLTRDTNTSTTTLFTSWFKHT